MVFVQLSPVFVLNFTPNFFCTFARRWKKKDHNVTISITFGGESLLDPKINDYDAESLIELL